MVFSGICAYEPDGMVLTAAIGDGKQSVDAWYVSESYFDVLEVRAAAGRAFRPEEGRAPGGDAVVVISHGLWQRSFGGQSDAIGSSMRLNGNPFTIVGVAPEHFHGSSPVEPAPDPTSQLDPAVSAWRRSGGAQGFARHRYLERRVPM